MVMLSVNQLRRIELHLSKEAGFFTSREKWGVQSGWSVPACSAGKVWEWRWCLVDDASGPQLPLRHELDDGLNLFRARVEPLSTQCLFAPLPSGLQNQVNRLLD